MTHWSADYDQGWCAATNPSLLMHWTSKTSNRASISRRASVWKAQDRHAAPSRLPAESRSPLLASSSLREGNPALPRGNHTPSSFNNQPGVKWVSARRSRVTMTSGTRSGARLTTAEPVPSPWPSAGRPPKLAEDDHGFSQCPCGVNLMWPSENEAQRWESLSSCKGCRAHATSARS